MKHGFFRVAALLALALLTACDSDSNSKNSNSNTFQLDVTVQPLDGGRVDPQPRTYRRGDTVRLTAAPSEGFWFYAWEEDGQPLSHEPELTVTAEPDRRLTAVFVPLPTELAIQPVTLVVPEGARIPMRVTAIADEVAPRDVTTWAQWSSYNDEIADFDPAAHGVLEGKRAGSAMLRATFEARSGFALIHVIDPENGNLAAAQSRVALAQREATRVAVHFCYDPEAIGLCGDWICSVAPDNVVAELTWTSTDPSVAQVRTLAGEAVITGVTSGTAQVWAQHDDKRLEIEVTVSDERVDRVTIEPTALSLSVGGTAPLAVRAHSTERSWEITDQVHWSLTPPDVAAVDDGRVIGKQPGDAIVTAVMGEFMAGAATSVYAAPDAPGALTLAPRPNAILNDGEDSSRLVATIWPNDENATIADGVEVRFEIPEAFDLLAAAGPSIGRQVEVEVTAGPESAPQSLTVGAEVPNTVARAERALRIVEDLADIMTTAAEVTVPTNGALGDRGTGIVWVVLNTSNRDVRFDNIALLNGDEDLTDHADIQLLISAGVVLLVAALQEDIADPALSLKVDFTDRRTGKAFEVTESLHEAL